MATASIFVHSPFANGGTAQLGPANLTSRDDANPAFNVGGLYYDAKTGKKYLYVKFDNGTAVAAAAGNACYVFSKATNDISSGLFTVCSDYSDSLPIYVGQFVNVITDGQYGFVLVWGRQDSALLAASIEAGDALIIGSTDGQLEEATTGDIVMHIAHALEASA